MPTYLTLIEFTQQTVTEIQSSPALLEAMAEEAGDRGGELKDVYVTFGSYDAVAISEFPDRERYAEFVFAVASGGGVETETLTAFTESEYEELVSDLAPLFEPGGPPGEQFGD